MKNSKREYSYNAKDFDGVMPSTIQEALLQGKIAISSKFKIDILNTGYPLCIPYLYIRTNHLGKRNIDLFSIKRETFPNRIFHSVQNSQYLINENDSDILSWKDYQIVLAHLVKQITGLGVEEQIHLDMENFFLDILQKNFKNVCKREYKEIMELLPILIHAYPEEYERSSKKAELDSVAGQKKSR